MAPVIAEHALAHGCVLRLVHGDLTAEAVDAIVNAANSQLAHGGGVAAAIVRRGGPIIQDESDAWIRRHGQVAHDAPALTTGGRLPARHVIHAVGPVWGEGQEDEKLTAAVTGSLDLASRHAFASLALPAISTGMFSFPKERGARVILEAITLFVEAHPASTLREIRLTLIDDVSVAVFAAEFERRWPGSRRAS
jgi:putative ATPase